MEGRVSREGANPTWHRFDRSEAGFDWQRHEPEVGVAAVFDHKRHGSAPFGAE